VPRQGTAQAGREHGGLGLAEIAEAPWLVQMTAVGLRQQVEATPFDP
jgi:hypothetical protein